MKKVIITVVGKDTVGIIAKTSAYLAKANIRKSFEKVGAEMAKLGMDMGLKIRCQKSEIFEKMHRI